MIFEILSAFIIIAIGGLFLSMSSLTMPSTLVSTFQVLLILSFISFSALIWKEKASDEREAYHALIAGRIAYLVGVGVLVSAVIVQTTMHNIDPWLIITLCVMVLTKIILNIYTKHKM